MAKAAAAAKRRNQKAAVTKRARKVPPQRNVGSSYAFAATPDLAGLKITDQTGLTFSPVYRAVCLLADNIASFPLKVFRRILAGGRESKEHAIDHPINRRLQFKPNDEQTPFGFMQRIVQSMALNGNAYVEIDWATNNTALNLWPLDPNIVTVSRREKTRQLYYRIRTDGGEYELDPFEVLHIPMLGDGINGISPISAARQSIGLGLSAEGYGSAFFGNGSNPSGILSHPGKIGEEGRNRLRAALESSHKGVKNANRVLVLEEGMTWTQIGVKPEDAQFLQTRAFQVVDVARWFGIPPHMLGDMSKATYNNMEQAHRDFATITLRPLCTRIEQELNRKLLRDGGEFYTKFSMDALLRGDSAGRSAWYKDLFQMGVYSVNDIRELEDMSPIGEDGDKRLVQINLTTLEKIGEEPPKPQPGFGEPEPEEPQEPDEPDPDEDEDGPDDDAVRMHTALRSIFRDAAGRIVHKEVGALRRILTKCTDVSEADAAIRKFYVTFENDVRREFGPPWKALASVNCDAYDVEAGASRYVNDSRTALLTTLRTSNNTSGLVPILDAWSRYRPDNATEQFAEAYHATTETT